MLQISELQVRGEQYAQWGRVQFGVGPVMCGGICLEVKIELYGF